MEFGKNRSQAAEEADRQLHEANALLGRIFRLLGTGLLLQSLFFMVSGPKIYRRCSPGVDSKYFRSKMVISTQNTALMPKLITEGFSRKLIKVAQNTTITLTKAARPELGHLSCVTSSWSSQDEFEELWYCTYVGSQPSPIMK
jgi:hypothetical protein